MTITKSKLRFLLAFRASCNMPQAALPLFFALCAFLPTCITLQQYVSMIPNGGTFGVLNGHSSSSGGSGCARSATPALLFADACAAI